MISIRAEVREILDDWSRWSPPGHNRMQSLLNTVSAVIAFIAYILVIVAVKCYHIAEYLFNFILPWSTPNKNKRTQKRKEKEYYQLTLQASENIISVVPRQVQDWGITGKNANFLFHRVPFEIRRQILILAFGEQTVHMDFQFGYPFDLADKEREGWNLHARIDYASVGNSIGRALLKTEGERQEWRWFSCVCHRFPQDATQLPFGRKRNYPPSPFREPDTDRCLTGFGACEKWHGDWPVKCQIGIIGWLLSCKQAYLEGIDILYKTNTIHITSPVLIRAMQDLISRQRLADITSLELLWETKLAPLSMGFTGFANSRHKLPARPLFPGLRILRISFKRRVNDDEDYTLGITLPCRHKILLDHGVHNFFLPEVDKLLERMVPHTTDVTVTCPKWLWYEAIDLVLLEKQGKEETRMQRADIEGLKCWRNTPPRINMPQSIWDVSDRALEDAVGVEGRRKGFWVHVGIEEVRLNEDVVTASQKHLNTSKKSMVEQESHPQFLICVCIHDLASESDATFYLHDLSPRSLDHSTIHGLCACMRGWGYMCNSQGTLGNAGVPSRAAYKLAEREESGCGPTIVRTGPRRYHDGSSSTKEG